MVVGNVAEAVPFHRNSIAYGMFPYPMERFPTLAILLRSGVYGPPGLRMGPEIGNGFAYFKLPERDGLLATLPRKFKDISGVSKTCSLPLARLVVGTIDMERVEAVSEKRHWPYVQAVRRFLDGSSGVWKELKIHPRHDAGSSALTMEHVADLLESGLVRPLRRDEVPVMSKAFLTEKKNGRESRPLFDARRPVNISLNKLAEACLAPWGPKFRLLDPFSHVSVGVGRSVVGALALSAFDATSYFPQFPWATGLARLTAFRVGSKPYGHMAPPQGVSLVPWVAQVTSAALADAPVVTAPRSAWVQAGVSIIYDNWLMSASPDRLQERREQFLAKCKTVGVVIGEDSGVCTRVDSCGYTFDDRKWQLLARWAGQATDFLQTAWTWKGDAERHLRESVAGVSLWFIRASLRPWLTVRPLVRRLQSSAPWDQSEKGALGEIVKQIEVNSWRRLIKSTGRRHYVWSDASLEAAGRCTMKSGITYVWPSKRLKEQQQLCELEGAVLAVEAEIIYCREGDTLYLGLDNMGVQDIISDAFPERSYAAPLVRRIIEACTKQRVRLRTFYVPGERMPADPWSRPSTGAPCILPTEVSDAKTSRRAVWSYATDG